MPKKITAFKRDLVQPIVWQPRHNSRGVVYQVRSKTLVSTADGPMYRVDLRSTLDHFDPNVDVAILVGTVKRVIFSSKGVLDPKSQLELWFWDGGFWVKAASGPHFSSDDYYVNKEFALYQIEIVDSERLFKEVQIL